MFQVSSVELTSPEGECQKVDGEPEDSEGGGVEKQPVGLGAEGNVAELIDLKKRKRESEKGGRENVEREIDGGHGKHKNISEQHKDVMERHDPFPTEAREESDTLIFLVLCEGLEIKHDEKSKRQECERKRERQKWMRGCRLERERNGRIHIRQLHRQQKFTEAAVDEPERRHGINEDKNEGEDEKEESRKWQVLGVEENVGDHSNGRKRRHRNIQGVIA